MPQGGDQSRAPKCLQITSTPDMIGTRLIGSLARKFHIGFDPDYECHDDLLLTRLSMFG